MLMSYSGRDRIAVVALALLPYLGARPPEAPEVNTANFLPVIRKQIERAAAVAKERPRDANAMGMLAMTLHAYQQYEAAASAYSRAHSLEPGNFEWIYLLGAAQMQLGSFEEAGNSLRAALLIRPRDLAASLRLAEAVMRLGDWDAAGPQYKAILETYPKCPQAWYGSGRTRAAKGDLTGAVKAYTKACQLFPKYAAAHFALAKELRRMGKPAEAKEHLASYSEDPIAGPRLGGGKLLTSPPPEWKLSRSLTSRTTEAKCCW
jgi:tetratricopeptide (TPR) repeat protein